MLACSPSSSVGRQEAAVESFLTQEVRRLGGISEKLAPTHVGMPDRLVVLPGGHVWLIEVKTETGRLREAQKVWLARADAVGANVAVLYGKNDVQDWINDVRGHDIDRDWIKEVR